MKKRFFDFFGKRKESEEFIRLKEKRQSIYEQWDESQTQEIPDVEIGKSEILNAKEQETKSKILTDNSEISENKEVFKQLLNKKLTIILLENSQMATNFKDMILKIIHRLDKDSYICVITYGNTISISKKCKIEDFQDENLLNENDLSNKYCLYDSLEILAEVIKDARHKVIENLFERHAIKYIDVIGIGSGLDIGSKMSKSEAVICFDKILNTDNINTKYFCFSEDTFIDVATLGFRSIGAFPKTNK